MPEKPTYSVTSAIHTQTGEQRFVIVDRDGRMHPAGTAWLQYLSDSGRSPLTAREYGRRVAGYLSWCAQTMDWRTATLSHIALWRQIVAATPMGKTNGPAVTRAASTVQLWVIAVRSFYEWADAHELLETDLIARMTQLKYFPPGTRAGGEFGVTRRVLVDSLRSVTETEATPRWIADADARTALTHLELGTRDRFLVDLLSTTGIRVGEALSLFVADLHFGGGSRQLGCHHVDPHFHVRVGNSVENRARAKGRPRTLFVHRDVVEAYIDYALERREILSAASVRDSSPHVFVNVRSEPRWLGRAMSYQSVKRLMDRCSRAIGHDLSGPHMLRHTFATRLLRGIDCDPVPIDVVQSLLGHASITSTRIYTHDVETAMKAATSALAPRPTPPMTASR